MILLFSKDSMCGQHLMVGHKYYLIHKVYSNSYSVLTIYFRHPL